MRNLPPELVSIIRQLGGEGLPTEQIAFMTRTVEETVREILAKHGTLTPDEAKAEAEAAGHGPSAQL